MTISLDLLYREGGSKTTWNGRYVHEMRNSENSFQAEPVRRKMVFSAESTMASTPGCLSRRSAEMA